jgi:serine/threonine-protein kinase
VTTDLEPRYRVEQRLAQGGFGAVYRATHVATGAAVAIKVLHPQFAQSPEVVARFRREAAALAQLRDPHTVTLYEHGETADGTVWLAMELLSGESLLDRFTASGKMPWRRVVAIAREVCSSLVEAHALGIIHRDLKPANIHLERRGDADDYVKVIDFGIAKVLEDSVLENIELTAAGQMIGTYDYMSPEQLVGGELTPASDLYTLGVVMYEMISGVRPYPDVQGPASMLGAVLTKQPPSLASLCEVPPELDALVMRCLERDPDDRFASASQVADALDRVGADPAELEVTQIMVAPRMPLPTPPVFEARGSEAAILKPRFQPRAETMHDIAVRRFTWMLVIAVAVIIAIAIGVT